ncbi:MAG TPA: CPXCG motif-containing cysteine-rich protein [Planctomycetaceae bacterium]|nr:CPXCG motif-containing cysteine-rich protein [Planctomycetaceae bacterium]
MDETTYVCDCCGEEIVITIDISAGRDQDYVEDCPVCCNPMHISLHLDDEGNPDADCRAEQDRF